MIGMLVAYDLLGRPWRLPSREELVVRIRRAVVWGATVFLPYLGWSALTKLWIGRLPDAPYLGARLPTSAAGLLTLAQRGEVLQAVMFVLPAVVSLGLALWALARGRREIQLWLLLVAPLAYSILLGS
ncbi:MAG TPA: hypothetical protein VIN56_00275, partial [Candidatus Dormibacteraeota bacterium]